MYGIPMDSLLPRKVLSLDFLGSIYENRTFFLDTWAISLEMTQMMDPLFSIWNELKPSTAHPWDEKVGWQGWLVLLVLLVGFLHLRDVT